MGSQTGGTVPFIEIQGLTGTLAEVRSSGFL